MLIRVRSKDGNFRIDIGTNADMAEFAQKILETAAKGADPKTICVSSQPRGGQVANINNLIGQSVSALGLKHGDQIYITFDEGGATATKAEPSGSSGTNGSTSANGVAPTAPTPASAKGTKRIWETVTEDSVDTYWRQREGKIERGRDVKFCKHGPNAMCDYCMPLEPHDQTHHATNSIKHLSYHAYLRKIAPPSTSTSSQVPPLTQLSYKVKVPCSNGGHSPWPLGICTACQPAAITLQPQVFRMTDHIEFAEPDIINRFIDAWRMTGLQRFGWLIGHYEPYEVVPMGIKAVVEAIHEPMQEGELDGLTIALPWQEHIARLQPLLQKTGLCIVGQIFTDLTPREDDRTQHVYKRHPQSFFLSSLETIFAANMQVAHPTVSRSSPTGNFSSRFVTAVITGGATGGIEVAAYQASEQACAMVEADMIEASVDPGIVRVKEEDRTVGSARYVPEVFFRYKNEYGIEVKKSARPAFPVEYLLVNVTHGFPNQPSPLFRTPKPFHIENRPGIHDQTVDSVLASLSKLKAPDMVPSVAQTLSSLTPFTGEVHSRERKELAMYLSDWHLIAFMGTIGVLDDDDLRTILKVATAPSFDDPGILDELVGSRPGWQTLMVIARESAPRPRATPTTTMPSDVDDIPQELLDSIADDAGATSGFGGATKTCPHCTFENASDTRDCEVCGLPLT